MATPYDVAIRQQAFIEGVKNYEADAMDPTNEALAILLAALLAKSGYARIADMPKQALRRFVADFNKRADKLLEPFRNGFTKELKEIAGVTALLTALNYAALTGQAAKTLSAADALALSANDIIPGTGHLPGEMLKDFVKSAKNQIALLIKRAYVEKWNASQLAQALNGTKARNFKDGLLHKIKNQFNTVQQTLIQHITQRIRHALGKLVFTHYQWVSVLDSSTTDICRGRNGNVYEYGKGPLPPAHYNCRSTIVGINGVMAYPTPPTFYNWINDQPIAVQNELLGEAKARKLRAGKLGSQDFTRYESKKKIPPKDLAKYQPTMLK